VDVSAWFLGTFWGEIESSPPVSEVRMMAF